MSTLKSSAEHLTLNADGSGNDIKFQSNATEVAAIDQAGNLTLSGTVDGVDIQTLNTTAGAALPKAGGTMTGAILHSDGSTSAPSISFSADTNTGFYRVGSDKIGTVLGGSLKTTLTSTGLGIGTSSPANKFVVAEGTGQHGVEIAPGTLSYIQAYDRATSDYGDLSIDAQTIRFGTDNGTERVRIDSSGNVGIGITPLAKVDIAGNTDTWGGMSKIFLTDTSTNSLSRNWSIGNGGTAYGDLSIIYSNAKGGVPESSTGTAALVIDSAGTVTKPLQPAFHGYLNASVSNNNGWTAVPLNREKFDIGNNFSTSNGTFTVPVSGRYILTGHFHSQTAASYLYLAIYVGSTPLPYLDGRQSSNGTDTQLSGSVIVNLTANDAVTLSVYSNAGNFQIGGGDQRTSLAGYFLG